MRGRIFIGVLAGVVATALASSPARAAVSWSFDYQGELKNGGLPANGPTDLAFTLWNAESGGLQVGPVLSLDDVPVSDGVFTVRLDFTDGGVIPGVFDGNERFLEVSVEGTALTPRQRLSPAPNAVTAQILALPNAQQTTAPAAMSIVQTASAVGSYVFRASTVADDSSSCAIIGEMLTETLGNGIGVLGISRAANGFGVIGTNQSPVGNCSGVYGNVESPHGLGVLGWAASTTGPNKGVAGKTWSDSGWAGYFEGRGYFSKPVGIGVESPGAILEVQDYLPSTGLALNVDDRFFVSGSSNLVSVNRVVPVTGAEYFGVGTPATGTNYGGMYITTEDATARPFYGYAPNGAARAWTYYDGTAEEWRLSVGADRLVVPRTSGNVGVKRTPAANDFEVEGTASKTTAGSWLANSDARIKTGVEPVTKALETLERVRLVAFRYTDEYRAVHPEIEDRRYLNVIAQEFREVFPEHVRGSGEFLPDGGEILQVDTWPLTIYAAAAVQELHALIRERDRQLAARDARIEALEGRLARVEILAGALATQRTADATTAAWRGSR